MPRERAVAERSQLCATTNSVLRGAETVRRGVSRTQLGILAKADVIERVVPDTYRMTAVPASSEQGPRAALSGAGSGSMARGASAASVCGLDGVEATEPAAALGRNQHRRIDGITIARPTDRRALMPRTRRGFRVTGVEATLVALASVLDGGALETACEDARRKGLTSMPAHLACTNQSGKRGRPASRRCARCSANWIPSTYPAPDWK